MRVLRYKDAADKCGVPIMTVRRWATEDRYSDLGFPSPVRLGEHSTGFLEAELDDWIAQRAAERDGKAA